MNQKRAIKLAIEAMKRESQSLAALANTWKFGKIRSGKSAHERRTALQDAIKVLESGAVSDADG